MRRKSQVDGSCRASVKKPWFYTKAFHFWSACRWMSGYSDSPVRSISKVRLSISRSTSSNLL